MTAYIDGVFYAYRGMLPEDLAQQVTAVHESIDRSTLSAEYLVPVSDFDLHARDHSGWPADAYDLGMRYRNPHTDEEVLDVDGLEAKISRLESQIRNSTDDDEIDDLQEELAGWNQALDEPVYDEIMWNTVWRPRGELDGELAQSLGFGVLYVTSDFPGCEAGESYMGLQGGGMDLTPMLVSYCALKYKLILREWACYFRNETRWSWFKYVVGGTVAARVLEALEVPEPRDPDGS